MVARGGSRICEGGADHGERAEREPSGDLGAEPPAGSRGRAPGEGSWGQSPPEAESFLALERPTKFTQSFVFVCKVFIQKFERVHPERGR